MEKMFDDLPDDPTGDETIGELSDDALIDAVLRGFSARNRKLINREIVADVVASLARDDDQPSRRTPHLQVRRLRFSGEKRMHDQPTTSFQYDQSFVPGVNVICIEDNEVGKSTILKTIKYCLTGDNGDYDADIRSWITDAWLVFALDGHEFTALLSTRDGKQRASLIAGNDIRSLDLVVEENPLVLFDTIGIEETKAEFERFFFTRLHLDKLSWTQEDASAARGVADRNTSWLTYFQALQIPDDGDRYLICPPEHAMGNQDGLIFSTFLGLHLIKPLNSLGIEAAHARKEVRTEKQNTEEQVREATEAIIRLEAASESVRSRLKGLSASQAQRRKAVEGGEPAQRYVAAQGALTELASERSHLESVRVEMNRTLQQLRGRERLLREAAALHLHFTGLEVSLCPNCDEPVDAESVEHEYEAHVCRLCGKPAHDATPADVVALNAEADDIARRIEQEVHERAAISERLAAIRAETALRTQEAEALAQAAQQGIAYALPTVEEEAETSRSYEELGRLQAELAIARRRAEPTDNAGESGLQIRTRVMEKVREVLAKEAARRNQSILRQLGSLTQEYAQRVGAESISDVTCSPLGKVQLRKHGTSVGFTGIRNEGERLRVKLAFFLAMIRLGQELGLGRHPGFLLIDQPGSSEMVIEDFERLATIFRAVDTELPDHVQVICCTARRTFAAATDPSKVYGPQAPPYAF